MSQSNVRTPVSIGIFTDRDDVIKACAQWMWPSQFRVDLPTTDPATPLVAVKDLLVIERFTCSPRATSPSPLISPALSLYLTGVSMTAAITTED
jgi:hypothetical protein